MHHHKLLDSTGALFSLSSTVGYVLANLIAWPLGIVACLINVILYFNIKLYADSLLEIIYLCSQCYGWYYWRCTKKRAARHISHISQQHAIWLTITTVIVGILIAIGLRMYTHDSNPYWDASTTVISLAAQWLTCRKIIETWLLWFSVDVMYVGLYLYKDLPIHSGLMSAYVIMAIAGYIIWRQKIHTFTSANQSLGRKKFA